MHLEEPNIRKVGVGGEGVLLDVLFCLQVDGPIAGARARGGGAYQWGGV